MKRGYAGRVIGAAALLSVNSCGLLESNHVTVGADNAAGSKMDGLGGAAGVARGGSAGRGGKGQTGGTAGTGGDDVEAMGGSSEVDSECMEAVRIKDDVSVYWPADVAALPLMNHIAGDLNIHQGVTDLAKFRCLERVDGTLNIGLTTALVELNDLTRLQSVGKSLLIEDNAALLSLEGLSSLASVGASLDIDKNPKLADLTGLEQLTELGDLSVGHNVALRSLAGLGAVERVGTLSIIRNAVLPNLDGLALLELDSLKVTENARLTEMDALSSLHALDDVDIDIEANDSLVSLAGLNRIASGGNFTVASNLALTHLNGLDSLTAVADLTIRANPALESVAGLGALRRAAAVSVANNDALTNLDGLGLEQVESLSIYYNPKLVQIDGLSSLTEVVDVIDIQGDDELVNLDGLIGVQSATGINIYSSPRLKNVDGLAGLTSLGGIRIEAESLTSVEGLRNVTSMDQVGISAPLTSLQGLRGLKSLNILELGGTSIKDLTGLGKARISQQLNLYDNRLLESLAGLSSTSHEFDLVMVSGSPKLVDLAGLEAIQVVSQLYIQDTGILSVNGLDNLVSVETLALAANAALADISALASLTTITGTYYITSNPNLPSCAVDALLAQCDAAGGDVHDNDDDAVCD